MGVILNFGFTPRDSEGKQPTIPFRRSFSPAPRRISGEFEEVVGTAITEGGLPAADPHVA